MKHGMNEGKEIINQGRSKHQTENNYKITFWSWIGFLVVSLLVLIFS